MTLRHALGNRRRRLPDVVACHDVSTRAFAVSPVAQGMRARACTVTPALNGLITSASYVRVTRGRVTLSVRAVAHWIDGTGEHER